MTCELILIDGAIDRKSIASPETSDAIILATGAVLSRNLKKVVEDTSHIVNLYNLPVLEDGDARKLIIDHIKEDRIMLIKGDRAEKLDLLTGLGGSRFIDEAIDKDTEYVYIPGALTNSVIADIHPSRLIKKGFSVRVLDNITVAAVTVNPFAPGGYSFDHGVLLEAMQTALPEIPVIDVRM